MSIIFLLTSSSNLFSEENYIGKWRWNKGQECGLYFGKSLEATIKATWDGVGEPTLSISKAKEITHSWVKKEYNNEVTPSIVSFDLMSYRSENMKANHWLYNIRFVKFKNGIPHKEFNENIAVLMDGQVVSKVCGSAL